jgi:N4-(beta-N-acetylglucosaminyl)-L-asparaginase
MSSTRRSFLQNVSLGFSVLLVPEIPKVNSSAVGNAIVISTWDFGKNANTEAWEHLRAGGRSLDAVEAGVKITESDFSNLSVGLGGLPDRDGHVTLDACIMDEQGGCGSVMCLEHIDHPISVARLVMEKTPHVILTGEGALQFALENGFVKQSNALTPQVREMYDQWLKDSHYEPQKYADTKTTTRYNHDTIGMVAMDVHGNLSGACTTSGLAFKMHGRVGDSPVIGAGLFVDNEVGAATATGIGEEVIRIVGSHLVVEFMRQGFSPEDACRKALERIVKRNPEKAKTMQVGFLALRKDGNFGAFSLTAGFTYAVKSDQEEKIYQSKSWF